MPTARSPVPHSNSAPERGPARVRPDNVEGGILLVLGFACVIPFVEASAKALGQAGVAAPQITWCRFAFQVVVIGALILALNGGRIGPAPRPLWPFVLRGVLICLGSGLLYAGLAFLPMADSSAIFFVEPLLLTFLSAMLLGERVGWRRWTAVGTGLVGALLIVGPNMETAGWASLFPAGAAVSFAGAVLLTRAYAARASALTFLFTTALTSTLLLSLTLGIGWAAGIEALTPRWTRAEDAWLLLAIGVLATCTNLMLTQAFRIAPSSVLAPFLYLEIVGATIAGIALFGEVPGMATVAGGLLVVGAGLVVWWRERGRSLPPPPVAHRK
ncbi:MAG: DMT family transporter [Paracoccaceae bacterium]